MNILFLIIVILTYSDSVYAAIETKEGMFTLFVYFFIVPAILLFFLLHRLFPKRIQRENSQSEANGISVKKKILRGIV